MCYGILQHGDRPAPALSAFRTTHAITFAPRSASARQNIAIRLHANV
jgi:hypothetical protein